MFTGIITHVGEITSFDGQRLQIRTDLSSNGYELGESIAVNGVCLTVVSFEKYGFEVEVSPETLQRTSRASWNPGKRVNLERALRLGDRLGGHWVQGHVDGVGVLKSIEDRGEFRKIEVQCPEDFALWLIDKGSLCVHGISLTVNRVLGDTVAELMIIPHTWEETSLKTLGMDSEVHLEADVLGKYVHRQLSFLRKDSGSHKLSLKTLLEAGFGGEA